MCVCVCYYTDTGITCTDPLHTLVYFSRADLSLLRTLLTFSYHCNLCIDTHPATQYVFMNTLKWPSSTTRMYPVLWLFDKCVTDWETELFEFKDITLNLSNNFFRWTISASGSSLSVFLWKKNKPTTCKQWVWVYDTWMICIFIFCCKALTCI